MGVSIVDGRVCACMFEHIRLNARYRISKISTIHHSVLKLPLGVILQFDEFTNQYDILIIYVCLCYLLQLRKTIHKRHNSKDYTLINYTNLLE